VPRTLTTEFRKLATVRSPWLLLALGPLIVVAGITGLVASGGNVHDPALQDKAFGHVGLAAIFTLVFGILAVPASTPAAPITDTFLSFPRRRRVITAKLAAYGAVVGGRRVGLGATALLVTSAWWSAKGGTFHWSGRGHLETLGGGVAANAAFAAIGVGIGALVRNLVPPWPPPWPGSPWWRSILGPAHRARPGTHGFRSTASESLDRVSLTPGGGCATPVRWRRFGCCSATRWRSRLPRCSLHSSAMVTRKPAVLRDRRRIEPPRAPDQDGRAAARRARQRRPGRARHRPGSPGGGTAPCTTTSRTRKNLLAQACWPTSPP